MKSDNSDLRGKVDAALKAVRLHFQLVKDKYPKSEQKKMAASLEKTEQSKQLLDSMALIAQQMRKLQTDILNFIISHPHGPETQKDRLKLARLLERSESLSAMEKDTGKQMQRLTRWYSNFMTKNRKPFPELN
jgi:hypothetical protein